MGPQEHLQVPGFYFLPRSIPLLLGGPPAVQGSLRWLAAHPTLRQHLVRCVRPDIIPDEVGHHGQQENEQNQVGGYIAKGRRLPCGEFS